MEEVKIGLLSFIGQDKGIDALIAYLVTIRKACRLTQGDIASACGVSRPTIARLENRQGTLPEVNLKLLRDYAKAVSQEIVIEVNSVTNLRKKYSSH